MRRASKHKSQAIAFANLTGGVNTSTTPELIGDNDLVACQNFVYDAQRLVGRGGLKALDTFNSEIISLYYDIESNTTFVFLKDRNVWQCTISNGTVSKRHIGKVGGARPPKCEKFKGNLFVVSGDKLQYYDFSLGGQLITITNSPMCDLVFYRFARLMVCMTGSDRIYYSATGDATSKVAWEEDTNDASLSQWIDIGDCDSGDIVDIVPLATDIMVFKNNGKAYQFAGDADTSSWAVYNVANYTDLTGNFTAGHCATNIGNEVVFISLRGLKTLSATQDYGNISASDIGGKFNNLLTKSMYEPALYNMPRHRMIFIRHTSDRKFYVVYNYSLGAATTCYFGIDVNYILETKDDVFVAGGSKLYLLDDTATTDDELPIEYVVKPRGIISTEEMLVKSIDTKFSSDHAGSALLTIGERLRVDMPTNARRKVRCNHSCDYIDLTVSGTSRFALDHITLEVSDL